MGLLYDRSVQFFTNAGAVLASGTVEFLSAGGSSPGDRKNTYSDKGLTSANSNPETLDSAGRFSATIYGLEDEDYKIIVKDSTGTTIFTEDNIPAKQLVGASTQTRIDQATSNPLDQGAVGDGAADETTEVQAAIDAATGEINGLGKTYKCDTELTLDDNLTFRNMILDCSANADTAYLSATGSQGTTTNLSSNAAEGAMAVVVDSVSGLAEGDWVALESGDTIYTSFGLGELNQIVSISGSTVNLAKALSAAFNTADTATLRKVTMKKNIIVEDVNLTGQGASGSNAMSFTYCENVVVRNCRIDGVEASGIFFRSCANCVVVDCVVEDDNAGGAGVMVENRNLNIHVARCYFNRIDHGIELGSPGTGESVEGYSLGTTIRDCRIVDSQAESILLHENARWTIVDGCFISGAGSDGISMKCVDVTISGCRIDYPADEGIACLTTVIALVPADAFQKIYGCVVNGALDNGIEIDPICSVAISDCQVTNPADNGIIVTLVSTPVYDIRYISIQNCQVDDADSAIIAQGEVDKTLINISGNSMFNTVAIDIKARQYESAIIANNNIMDGAVGIDSILEGAQSALLISGNHIDKTSTSDAMSISSGDATGNRITIIGNSVRMGNGLCLDLDAGAALAHLVMSGNYWERSAGAAPCVDIDGVDYYSISGEQYRNLAGAAAYGCDIAGSTNGTADGCFSKGTTSGHINTDGTTAPTDCVKEN